MAKMIAIHPGEILRTEYLEPLGIAPFALAKALNVTAPRVNDIVLERRGISADMAIRLGLYFRTTPQLWSNLQAEYDRRVAVNALSAAELKRIKPFVIGEVKPVSKARGGRPRKQQVPA